MSIIKSDDLVIHILNVGFGDNIIIEFPEDNTGNRSYGIVDCCDFDKTDTYLKKLKGDNFSKNISFICATHPHMDHIRGINNILLNYDVHEFWDSGFRHNSNEYRKILTTILNNNIKMVRVSSGMEWYWGKVRISALSPSVSLRNRYHTYGVDMNNASIVLRLEHHSEDVILMKSREYMGRDSEEEIRNVGKAVVILSGDAEFDSWSHISLEYPQLERTSNHNPLIKKIVNFLSCSVLKVSHHGSMHSTPLDICEQMSPNLAVISTKQRKSTKMISGEPYSRELFPHQSSILALKECGSKIITTDGSYSDVNNHYGSIIIVIPPSGNPRWTQLNDGEDDHPDPVINI